MEPVKIVKPGDAATGHHGSAPARPGSPPAPRAAVFRHPRRVAEKAGFTVEGVAHAAVTHRGAKLDEWVGALLAADRSGAKADGTREPR